MVCHPDNLLTLTSDLGACSSLRQIVTWGSIPDNVVQRAEEHGMKLTTFEEVMVRGEHRRGLRVRCSIDCLTISLSVCLSVCLSFRNWVETTLWTSSQHHPRISPPFVTPVAPPVSPAPYPLQQQCCAVM